MRIQSHFAEAVNVRDGQRRAATALVDSAALESLATDPAGAQIGRAEKLAPALARAAARAGLDTPCTTSWRTELRSSAAARLWLGDVARLLARLLGEVAVPFAPIKGWDLGRRVYPVAEERPTSDLDLLLPPEDLERVVAALEAQGFRLLQSGPRAATYLRDEGYAAALKAPGGQLVELHFRLWGSAPADLASSLLAAGQEDRELGPTARRLLPEHAYLLAAFHLFLDAPPRPAGAFRDLALLAERGIDVAVLVAEARRFGLDLPVALGSAVAAELFGQDLCRQMATELRGGLRRVERWVPWSADASAARMGLARMFAGRPSRLGWRLLFRRAWPHPGVVEGGTAEGPWWLRRLWYQWGIIRGKSGPGDGR